MENTDMGSPMHPLSAEQNERLDQLLAQWRQRHILAAAVADQVRHDVLATTESLPAEWWISFEERMHRLFTAVNQVPLWGAEAPGNANQIAHYQWEVIPYQQNYWRPVTVSQ